jgi:hypothetical protein
MKDKSIILNNNIKIRYLESEGDLMLLMNQKTVLETLSELWLFFRD